MQRVRFALANIIMVKWEAGDQHGIYQCSWNPARTDQWCICYGTGFFCPTEKSLTSVTTNGHSSPALLCISGLSVCRMVLPSSPSLLFASLPMPISALIAKKMLFIFKLIISVPRLFWHHRIHHWCFLWLWKQLNHIIEGKYILLILLSQKWLKTVI